MNDTPIIRKSKTLGCWVKLIGDEEIPLEISDQIKLETQDYETAYWSVTGIDILGTR